jgi:xanthine dehydrogenase YagS FAD-binding subunit
MQSFAYERASTLRDALGALRHPGAAAIAGGTELLSWMKDGIASPRRLVDVSGLPGLQAIHANGTGLTIGALARMSDVAADRSVLRDYPAIAQALLQSASAQIRNMATIGGNLMQETRCPYFRAETELPCNRRRPGSGCAASAGDDRAAAVFGWSDRCIATHPSDLAVALAALDTLVDVEGRHGRRSVPLDAFYRLPGETPERGTTLEPGELIVAVSVPAAPLAARSAYLKVRERASFDFALVSAAVALDCDGDHIRAARIALGGVAAKPWRLVESERLLAGRSLEDSDGLRRCLDAGFAQARPRRDNGFKIELARRTALRAIRVAGGMA